MADGEVLVLVELLKVKDPEKLAEYQAAARAQSGARGAKVIARGAGGYFGEPGFGTLMVQQWPSEVAFRQWQESDEYRPLLAKRAQAADLRIAVIPTV